MNSRAHAVLARAAGFCFGIAGLLLSIFSAIISAVVVVNKKPLGYPRRRRFIPTITMTRADDGDAHLGVPQLGTVLYAEPLSFVDETGPRPPPLGRSASSPELTTIPASSFLRPPRPDRRKKRPAPRKAVNQPPLA
ncbi:hypothetical protein AX14_012673 [Amanita brunnescens Koide BX004]|nr:hypothetical protein AX14_012673 [Amanita brunnescens Koide BX004]